MRFMTSLIPPTNLRVGLFRLEEPPMTRKSVSDRACYLYDCCKCLQTKHIREFRRRMVIKGANKVCKSCEWQQEMGVRAPILRI